ncbi:cupredoxin family copper-binding protein [Streptomyces sp. NBC_01474]|uniref:cupredoxin domain-containing protein n=1 Tax=unclassified Streptomyces TaxID=2593676 RepID=UPI002DD9B426|nr:MULTISPECIES: cupredoxin family copper-binding protein [unclassified Streptomyces]WSD95548.1 cupredoxin family copper-binding protein [Streptomyces sp. NBC_01474]
MSMRHRRPHTVLIVAALCLVTTLTGCSGSGDGSPSSSSPPASPSAPASASPLSSESGKGEVKVTIKGFAFHPATFEVSPGTKITVTNEDSATHTLTADDKSFDTGDLAQGKSATFTAPSKPGSYSYICTIHTNMKGTLTVR